MIILGIESTCDETAASLVEDGRHLLSNVISTSVKEQALYGGVVPEIASRRHCGGMSPGMATASVPSIWYTPGQSPAHWVQPMQSSGSTKAFIKSTSHAFTQSVLRAVWAGRGQNMRAGIGFRAQICYNRTESTGG